MKNLKISGNPNFHFTYDNFIERSKFNFIFLYCFMKSKYFMNDELKASKNFNEIMVLISECLLDNYKY